jgi:hypothetical protein
MYDIPQQVEKPLLVIAGTENEYRDYLREHNLTMGEALFITAAGQLDSNMYPMDCPIATVGQYWRNNAHDSRQHRERKLFLEHYQTKAPQEKHGNAMRFGGEEKTLEQRFRDALQAIANDPRDAEFLRLLAQEALKGDPIK